MEADSDLIYKLFSLVVNLLGFPAAVPLASGLDTGPYSGRPGRVRC